ncbi:MAG: maltose alpha-D-glucosyltransferase [Candidatus Promineifilaceae bacterium]
MSTNWYGEAVFYELYLRAFYDSNGDGHGDLRGAISKLDYIKSLGVDCIWILPHFPSPLKDDGYDVADYRNVHPDYGTLDDFRAFVDAAHARGLRVVIDLVMNHTSDQHPWFQAARQDRHSPYRDYYVWSDTGTEYSDIRLVFPDFEPSNWTWDAVAGQYFWHRFFRSQPDLNFDNPKVHEEMLDIVRFWLDLGVDGFRLDAVIYLYEREGTDGAGLPETHAFIQKVRRLLDQTYPDRVMIAEANDWPEALMAYFGEQEDRPECHMCFNFPIMPRLYLALLEGDRRALDDILRRTPQPPAGGQWLSFLRNHDELSLEMVTDEEGDALYAAFAPDPRMKINNGIRRRLAPILGFDVCQYRLLTALLMSLPGTPILYYGDEIGMGDNIWLADRNGVRTPMQWDGSLNAGFSSAEKPYAPIADSAAERTVAAQHNVPNSFLETTRKLVSVRQASPALRHGSFELVDLGEPALFGFRRSAENETIFCLFNLSNRPQAVSQLPAGHNLLDTNPNSLTLEPYGVYWITLD